MNKHYLPKDNKYREYASVVCMIQFAAVIVSDFLWLYFGLIKFDFAPALWIAGIYVVPIVLAALVGAVAKRIISRKKLKDKILIAQSHPLEWKQITMEMFEYLRKKRRFPWIAVFIFGAFVAGLFIFGAPFEIWGVVLVFTAAFCGALGFFIAQDSFMCVSQLADFAVVHVHHTFTRLGVKYAVVYLPTGCYVYRLKKNTLHREVKQIVFLSCLMQARLVCDEEFVNIID